MAATNFTPIQLYFSTTASAVPTAANLAQGELAINITDGKLYYEDNGGVVQVIATKGAGTIGGSTTQIQYNNAGALAGNAAMTFNSGTNTTTLTTLNLTNALGAIYGGTAQSTYTQGDFLYASATNTLSKLGIGTVNYILTSTGSVPQWVAPTSVTVNTATNLAGGVAGSVPYQSGVATTTFLAIGAANRVMTSSGTAPQWVTALTGLTGVSSSSITNTSLTSGRVVVSSTAGLQADDADLTFDGTTLSAGGFSTVGLSTLVKTVKIGDSSFNGVAVFAAATPAKLYMGTGTVTDVTSAISATNAIGAIASLGITPIAATNTSVTYTNAATLYIAGAPSASTNVTITNPYSLYVAAGAAYFGGAVTVAGSLSLAGVTVTSLTNTGLTSGRVVFSTTGGLETDSANLTFDGTNLTLLGGTANGVTFLNGSKVLTSGSALTFDGTTLATAGKFGITGNGSAPTAGALQIGTNGVGSRWVYNAPTGGEHDFAINGTTIAYVSGASFGTLAVDATIYGLTVGRGAGAVATNTAVGASALAANGAGANNTGVGKDSLLTVISGSNNTGLGSASLKLTTGSDNTGIGYLALILNNSGSYNTSVGSNALYNNTIASNNTAVGYQAGYTNSTGTVNTFIGVQAGYYSTAGYNTFLGHGCGADITSGAKNTIIGRYTGNQGNLDIRTASNYIVLSDGDGNPRMSLTGSAVQYEIYSGRALFSWANVSSTSVDLNTLLPNINTSTYGISLELQIITGTSGANQSSQIIHGAKTISGVWVFSTISTIGTQTTVATGSGGSTLTLTFIGGGQFGRCVVNALTQN